MTYISIPEVKQVDIHKYESASDEIVVWFNDGSDVKNDHIALSLSDYNKSKLEEAGLYDGDE